MAIGTTNFPTSLDTATELIRAVSDAKTAIDTGGATTVRQDSFITLTPVGKGSASSFGSWSCS
jgi:hypothetical protein